MHLHQLDTNHQEQCRQALNTEQNQSLASTNHWQHVDRHQVHQDWDILYKTLAPLINDSKPSDTHIQQLIAQHYNIACRFYTPSKEAYIGMALFYHENENMMKFHNTYHPNMIDFLGDAMYVYADINL